MFTISIAGLNIGLDNRFPYVERLARQFKTEDKPLFVVFATDEDIEREKLASSQDFSDGYIESIVLYRKIAERLPEYDGFVFHGAVLACDGVAYAFAARSGTGKTTHTSLWIREFGDEVHYVNGDKPIIRFIDGVPYACDTPWRGKEGYGSCDMVRLEGIVLLERGEVNSAVEIPLSESVIRLLKQIYVPKQVAGAQLTMRLADRLTGCVRFFELKCNMDAEAAHVCRRALTS